MGLAQRFKNLRQLTKWQLRQKMAQLRHQAEAAGQNGEIV